MKARNSFVSNSSTTSFLLAICKKIDPKEEVFLNIFEQLISNWDENTGEPTTMHLEPSEYVAKLKEKISEFEKDIAFGKKKLDKVAKILGNNEVLLALDEYQLIKYDISLSHRRGMEEARKKKPKEIFEDATYSYRTEISSLERKMKEAVDELNLIGDISKRNDIKYLCKLKIDNGFNSKIEMQIKTLIDNGVVEVIRKETI